MPEVLKAPLVLAIFAVLSVAITAGAAGLALHRPAVSRLALETRSRLVADYSTDPLAKRLEPLNPAVIRAASEDEAALSAQPTVQIDDRPSPSATPGDVPLVASTTPPLGRTPTATVTPPRSGVSSPTPPVSATRPAGAVTSTPVAGSSTPGPSPTPTVVKPTPTFTPPPTFTLTPLPTNTPPPTPTPPPTKTPQPTATPQPTSPPPTNTPRPTATPKNVCDVLPLPPIPLLCP
jgi:hypothetical protein